MACAASPNLTAVLVLNIRLVQSAPCLSSHRVVSESCLDSSTSAQIQDWMTRVVVFFRLFTNSLLLKKHNGLVTEKQRLFIFFFCHHSQCGNNKLVYLWIKIHLNIFLSLCFTISKGLICVLILCILILYMRPHKISGTDSDCKWKRFRGL